MRLTAALGALVGVLFVTSLLIGSTWQPPRPALAALFGRGDPLLVLVMQELRLPRAILGAAVGASLGLAGAAMQGFLRNPLAEPGLIGTSGTAALGAVLAIQTGLAAPSPWACRWRRCRVRRCRSGWSWGWRGRAAARWR